ncbi:hypothetical protein BpHYR1_025717 [Brachionus plicatilis]|uniref:Uncharacterized protein n=1 Tax=Brachionus plicatilis TaxID=10195 RepID=A0A3M7SGN1_BRAPC|nr:hypothetical protein BpHYR1_025717 [Brachionus plicatilis]
MEHNFSCMKKCETIINFAFKPSVLKDLKKYNWERNKFPKIRKNLLFLMISSESSLKKNLVLKNSSLVKLKYKLNKKGIICWDPLYNRTLNRLNFYKP